MLKNTVQYSILKISKLNNYFCFLLTIHLPALPAENTVVLAIAMPAESLCDWLGKKFAEIMFTIVRK